jgi:predicted Zn-dependent protease
MTTSPAPDSRSDYFDGTSNRKRRVTLSLGESLDIVEDGATIATWPYESIRRADGPPGMLRLASTSALPLARIEVEDPATIEALIACCTSLDVERGGAAQTRRILLWSIAAVCSIVLMVMYGIPYAAERLTPLVPDSVERRMGDAVAGQVRVIFGGKTCDEPEGQAAFTELMEKLRTAAGIERPFEARVLASPIDNALALPGGKVFMLNGLLQKARNPDELAGVLAHELGHVHHRHSMRMLIQTGGTSFLIGLLLGDVTGGGALIFVTQTLLDASHSRDSEEEADNYAAMVMQKLGRSPLPMAEFLFRITGEGKKESKALTIVSSHPLTEARLAMMKKLDRPATGPELLSERQWQALKNICRKM